MAELCECKHPKNYHNEVGCGGVVELRTSAIVNHAACKCKSYRPPAEPDATERARAFFVKQGKWDLAERFDGWQCCELMTAFLESERPRIKADAVREFIAEVEKEIIEPSGDDLFDGHQLLTTGSVLRVMRSIQARQVAKEMTEEAK